MNHIGTLKYYCRGVAYIMAKASSNSKNRVAAQFLWPNFLLNVALSLEGTSIRLVRKAWIASTTRSVLYCVKGKLENEPLFFQNIWQIVIFLWLNANCYNHGDIKTEVENSFCWLFSFDDIVVLSKCKKVVEAKL